MALLIELFQYQNDSFQNAVQKELTTLKETLRNDGLGNQAEKLILTNEPERWRIENYPNIWAKSDRSGASVKTFPKQYLKDKKILGKNIKDEDEQFRDYDDNILSAYEDIIQQLKTIRKSLPLGKTASRKAINLCISNLKAILEGEKLKFLYYMMRQTAYALIEDLDLAGYRNKLFYQQQIKKLIDFSQEERALFFKTANDSLNFSNQSNALRKALIDLANTIEANAEERNAPYFPIPLSNEDASAYWGQETLPERIRRRARQLDAIAKLFSDPFYSHPREYTTSERQRSNIRKGLGGFAGICGILLIVLLFYCPPLAFVAVHIVLIIKILTIVGLIASAYLAGDLFYENLFRHLIHGRTPTVKQVVTLIFSGSIAALYMIGMHASPIVQGIAKIIPGITKKMAACSSFFDSISDFFNRKVQYAANLTSFKEIFAQANGAFIFNIPRPTVHIAEKVKETVSNTNRLDFFNRHKSLAGAEFILIRAQPLLTRWQKVIDKASQREHSDNLNQPTPKQAFAKNNKDEVQELLLKISEWTQRHQNEPLAETMITDLRRIETVLKAINLEIPVENIAVPEQPIRQLH